MRTVITFFCGILLSCMAQADGPQPSPPGDSPGTAERYFDDSRAAGDDKKPFAVDENSAPETNPAPEEEVPHPAENDLTAAQAAFYWSSFNWMMEWGKDEEIRSFDDKAKHIAVTYHAGSRFMTRSRRLCRPYSLRLERKGGQVRRGGIACQVEPGKWCRLREDKAEECQWDSPEEWDSLTNSIDIRQRNISIGAGRFLRDLGF